MWGDYVYLKVQPYVQTLPANRSSNKLSFRYFGPYQIISKIGTVAYKLQLRDGRTVHPVFHVSLLKRAVHPTIAVSLELSDLSHELQVPYLILTDVYINGKIRCSLKCLLSGPSGQLSCLPGKMKMYYAINFQGRRLGVKPVLKGEGMSPF